MTNLTLAARGNMGLSLADASGGAVPWWMAAGVTPVAAYQAKGAVDLANSYINLANPGTFNAAPGVAPAWAAATGWTFTAASSTYLTTGITAPPDQSWSAFVQYTSLTAALRRYFLGGYRAAQTNFSVGVTDGNRMLVMNNVNGIETYNVPAMSSGNYGISGRQPYRNGIAEATLIPVSVSANPSFPIFIGAQNNNNGGTIGHSNSVITAIIILPSTLSSAQVLAQVAAMAAL